VPAVVTVLVLAVACLGMGCGTAGREHYARDAVARFQAAVADRDGAAACAELSSETSKKLELEEKVPCERAILGLGLPAGRPGVADVSVTSASVSLRGGTTLFLDDGPGGWKISAAGCRPTAPDKPFDCDLES
jgi:hypothetical protein